MESWRSQECSFRGRREVSLTEVKRREMAEKGKCL
jgi:hypothetical protein